LNPLFPCWYYHYSFIKHRFNIGFFNTIQVRGSKWFKRFFGLGCNTIFMNKIIGNSMNKARPSTRSSIAHMWTSSYFPNLVTVSTNSLSQVILLNSLPFVEFLHHNSVTLPLHLQSSFDIEPNSGKDNWQKSPHLLISPYRIHNQL